MTSPILLPGQDPMLAQAQALAEQEAMQKAMVDDFLTATISRIYAESVAPLLNATKIDSFNKIVPDLRDRAEKSRMAALVLGQALGMVRIQQAPRGAGQPAQQPVQQSAARGDHPE